MPTNFPANEIGDEAGNRIGRRDLYIGFGLAAVAVVVGLVALLLIRSAAPPAVPIPLANTNEVLQEQFAAADPVDRSRFDSRLSATRRLGGDGNEQDTPAPELGITNDELADGTTAAMRASGPDKSSSDPRQPNSRQLLKKMRRQVGEGDGAAALETSRQIASTLDDSEARSGMKQRIEDSAAAHGQGQQIDFDSLMELIRNTIAPNTWDSTGGPGTMRPFPGGVYVDTNGLMRARTKRDAAAELTRVRQTGKANAHQPDAAPPVGRSELRFVSLPKLEREVIRCIESNVSLPDEVRFLAGLTQVRYVLFYPEEHDVVIAGPAEAWRRDELGRVVGADSGRPVLQLDDLVVILRACFAESERRGVFGCSIDPRADRLAAVQQFVAQSSGQPIEPTQRNRWVAELRDQLGEQDIDVFGVPAGSRVAHVLIEADYRMKLIGIGLERAAVEGIPNYFKLLGEPTSARLARGLDMLRWWFTMNYDAVIASPAADSFELRGDRVQALSENELPTAAGRLIHLGRSDPVIEQFARNFTDQFAELAAHDATFADLAGVFDLAAVAGLMSTEHVPERVGWPMTTLLDPDEYLVPIQPAPRSVESVVNHRVYRGRHIIAVVSGGVIVDPWKVAGRDKRQTDLPDRLLRAREAASTTHDSERRSWRD